MKDSKQRWKNFLTNKNVQNFFAIFLLIGIVLLFFWKFFFKGLVPFPGDFIVGVYYPWLDMKFLGFEAGVPVKNPLLADVPSLIYPLRLHAVQILKGGELPLWNHLQFGGYPLIATFQAAVFNPLNIFFFFMSEINAWSLQIVFQPLLASIFMYFFIRELGLSKTAGVLGGIVYAFSGFNSIWLEYNVHGHVTALIPLLLLLVNRYLSTNKIIYLIGLSFGLTMQIFAGYPQVTIYTFALLYLWTFFRLHKEKDRRSGVEKLIKISMFIGLGICLSAVQLLPGYELMSQSQRLMEGVAGGRDAIFLPYRQLIGIFAPDVYGNPTTLNYWGTGDYTNNVGYTGVSVFVLAMLSVFTVKRKEVKFFFLLAIGSLFFSLPSPISNYLYNSGIPGVGAAVATRILVLFNFSLAILASFAIDHLQNKNIDFRDVRRAIYVPTIVLVAGIAVFTAKYWYAQNLSETISDPEVLSHSTKQLVNYKVFLRNSVLPIIFTFLAFSFLLFRSLSKRSSSIVGVLFILLITAELFRFGWKYNPFTYKEFVYPSTPVWEYLQDQEEAFRVSGGDVVPISMWMPYGLESASGYDAIYPGRIAKFISVINTNNPSAGPMGRFGEIQNYNNKLFDLTNTKYIMALKRNEIAVPDPKGKVSYKFESEKFEKVFDDETVAIMQNKDYIPRVFLVTDWKVIKDEQAILESLIDEELDYLHQAIVEKEPGIEKNNESNFQIQEVSYQYNQYYISLQTEDPALLIILDSWYPGWKVYVNGQEKDILKANYVYRAVEVGEGDSVVEFVYQPESFYWGSKISLVTFLYLLFVIGKEFVNKRSLTYTNHSHK